MRRKFVVEGYRLSGQEEQNRRNVTESGFAGVCLNDTQINTAETYCVPSKCQLF